MNFESRLNRFSKLFTLVLSTSLSFGIATSLYADDSVSVVNNEASTTQLNQLFSNQWVCLSKDNSISGRLVQLNDNGSAPLMGLPVALVRDGEVVYSAKADDKGAFVLSDVKTGSYSLVVRTNESIAAFSLQVLDAENSHLGSSVEVRVVRPAGAKITEILRSQSLPSYTVREEIQDISTDPLGDSRSFSKSHLVKIDSEGKLSGQLGSAIAQKKMEDMVVYVLRNGKEVARTVADSTGKFSFEGLKPGAYGFVAAGNSGFAATSFQLVSNSNASVGSNGSRLISAIGDACGQMNVEVVACCEVVACEQPVETVVTDACAVPVDDCGIASTCGCGGGFGGGFGGGGGGGGGIGAGVGGLGGLAAIGALAAVGIVAAADDNNNAPVVSPIR